MSESRKAPSKGRSKGGDGGGARNAKQPKGRALREKKNRMPKVVENPKQCLYMRGTKGGEMGTAAMRELALMRKPLGKTLQRKNDLHPFETADISSVEFLCEKNDCSLFVVSSHSKKRPNNLVLGRTFDGHVLDMLELGVESLTTLDQAMRAYPGMETKALGAKPCVVFVGDAWERDPEYSHIRNLLLDHVRGDDVTGINLAGLDHVISFTAMGGKIHMRTYTLKLKKSTAPNSNVPSSRLVLSAPSMCLCVRRCHWASSDLWKRACKQPKELKAKKVKNITTNSLGETRGQVHIDRQDLSELQTRKVKALYAHKAVPIKDGPSEGSAEDDGDDYEDEEDEEDAEMGSDGEDEDAVAKANVRSIEPAGDDDGDDEEEEEEDVPVRPKTRSQAKRAGTGAKKAQQPTKKRTRRG